MYLHFCWFSGDPYPELIQRCLDSWKRCLPQHEIKIWTYEMAAATGIPFVLEALQERKWAFAADAIRLYALYHDGGVYMDSDVYVLRDFTPLLTAPFVSSIELIPEYVVPSQTDSQGHRLPGVEIVGGIAFEAAWMYSEPHHPFVEKLLQYYQTHPFILATEPEKRLNTSIISPHIYAREAEAFGFRYVNERQLLSNGSILIYPSPFIKSVDGFASTQTYAIHCCNGSWRVLPLHRRIHLWLTERLDSLGLRPKDTLYYVRNLDKEMKNKEQL